MNTKTIEDLAFHAAAATISATRRTAQATAGSTSRATARGGFKGLGNTLPLPAGENDDLKIAANEDGGPVTSFCSLVKSRENQKGISFTQALDEISRENPRAAAAYHNALLNPITALPLENHPFTKQAKSIAEARGVSEHDATIQLARENSPLYKQYCASLSQDGRQRGTAQAGAGCQTKFLLEVQTAQAGGMSFDEAVTAVASSRPDLAVEYRRSFLPTRRTAQ
jgi:hypothetical protein